MTTITTTVHSPSVGQQAIQAAYHNAKHQHQQAWEARDYAALGKAALDMRDAASELELAQGELLEYI